MICVSCGGSLTVDARICGNCGATVRPPGSLPDPPIVLPTPRVPVAAQATVPIVPIQLPAGIRPPVPVLPDPPVLPEPPVLPDPPVVQASLAMPVSEAVDAVAADEDDDEIASTVVVDRSPTIPWKLHIVDGPTFSLTGEQVVLGRKPGNTAPDQQRIAIPDSTRTLSKVHAQLDLTEGRWTITDVGSTNGVVVIEPDGAERLLESGTSAVVEGRFQLGRVEMWIAVD
ncbi:hypothetical protein BH11ACT3_BH11ACT3_01120 [soil metagenome]